MEYDIHTFLDLLTLLATLLVIYMLWFPLRDSYQAAEDNIQSYYVVSLISGPSQLQHLNCNMCATCTGLHVQCQPSSNQPASCALTLAPFQLVAWHMLYKLPQLLHEMQLRNVCHNVCNSRYQRF